MGSFSRDDDALKSKWDSHLPRSKGTSVARECTSTIEILILDDMQKLRLPSLSNNPMGLVDRTE